MNPSEQFRRFAAECEAMSNFAESRRTKLLDWFVKPGRRFPIDRFAGCPNPQTLHLWPNFFTAPGNIRRCVGLATYCGD